MAHQVRPRMQVTGMNSFVSSFTEEVPKRPPETFGGERPEGWKPSEVPAEENRPQEGKGQRGWMKQ